MIKIFFTIDELGVSEKAFGGIPTDGARAAESPKSCPHESEAVENSNQGDSVIKADACDSSPSRKRSRTDGTPVSDDKQVMKLQKMDEQVTESTAPAVATEEAILELAESRGGVSHSLRPFLLLEP
jgi:hypothetical protein